LYLKKFNGGLTVNDHIDIEEYRFKRLSVRVLSGGLAFVIKSLKIELFF
jgi:hypothetical protein